MRVITGTARGRKLAALEGDSVRPTSDMVKEAIFSIIQFDIEGAMVLDLFSGTGQLGIEAVSRGAKECRFVDQSAESLKCTRENIAACGFGGKCTVTQANAIDFLRQVRLTFDIALLDPPYNKGLIPEALPLLEVHMSDRGIIVCEHEKELILPETVGRMTRTKVYRYGKIGVTVYRKSIEEE